MPNTDESGRERRHASLRARRRQSLFFCLAAQARKLSLQGSLGWAGGTLACHARNSDGDAAIEVLSFASVFWVDRVVVVAVGRSSWCKNCASTAMIFFRSHRRGTLCYGLNPWARLLSRSPPVEVHDLSPRLGSSIVPKHRLPRKCWPSGNMPCKLDNSPTSKIFDPTELENNVFWDFLFNSIGSTCRLFSLAPIYKCLLGDSFFTNHMKLQID